MAVTTQQKASLLYKNFLGKADTRTNREFFEEAVASSLIVKVENLWTYSDMIPNGSDASGGPNAIADIKALNETNSIYTWYKSEAEPTAPLVKFWKKLKLQMIDEGTDNAFIAIDPSTNERIRNIIPFNFYEDVYNYKLYDENDNPIYFGVGDWVFDVYSSVLTFYGDLPESVSHTHCPKISFYQYLGGIGFKQEPIGFQGAVLPINNIKIPTNTVAFNTSNGQKLRSIIAEKANLIEDNFTDIYKFDGNDENAGIALDLEKIIPLLYFSTKDNVKGYDNSINADIGTILSDKEIERATSITNLNIVFVSQKVNCNQTYNFKVLSENFIITYNGEEHTYSLVGREWQAFRIDLDFGFIIVQKTTNKVEDLNSGQIKFKASKDDVNCALIYWNSLTASYQPFVTNEENFYDFGFVVVAANGKIPPSLLLTSDSLSSFNDTITPDYYGPRTKSIVIALNTGSNIKSADYVVYNDQNRYLVDIFKKIEEDYEDFNGTIYLRPGIYPIKGNWDLSKFRNLTIESENGPAILQFDENVNFTYKSKDTLLTISNIEFDTKSINFELEKSKLFLSNINARLSNIVIKQEESSQSFLSNISASNLTVEGDDNNLIPDVYIAGSYFADVIFNKSGAFLRSSVLNSLYSVLDKKNYIKSCLINLLKNKYNDLFITGCTILDYDTAIIGNHLNQTPVGDASDRTGSSAKLTDEKLTTTGRFPIFDKDDFKHLKFAEFAKPFSYNKDQTMVELLYDREVLLIENGKLTTCINTDRIALGEKNLTFPRHSNSEFDPLDKTYTTDSTLTDVLKDLWHDKADLNEYGKIPLQELPDSVAYGGLLFVGTWSFDKKDVNAKGLYPTYEDAIHDITDDPSQVNGNKEYQLQKGWFFIVAPADGIEPGDNADENDNPVKEQIAFDGTVFTAGDWVVYQGDGDPDTENARKSWVKIDRAYEDPSYTILPSKANVPGIPNNYWWWKDYRDGGAIDLTNNTIIEAFDKINKYLRRLEPSKPLHVNLSKFKMAEDYPTFNYRMLLTNNVINPLIREAYDSEKITSFKIINNIEDKKKINYNELIYFGDSAEATVLIDDTILVNAYLLPKDDEKSNPIVDLFHDEPYSVTFTIPSMIYKDHDVNFWEGFYLEANIPNTFEEEGEHTFALSLDNIIIGIKNKNHAWNQYLTEYAGGSLFRFDCRTAYWPETLNVSYNSVSILTMSRNAAENMCSGIRCVDIDKIQSISGISFSIPNLYKNSMVPSMRLFDLRAYVNGNRQDPFTDITQQGDVNSGIVSFTTVNGYSTMLVETATLIVNHSSDVIFEDFEYIDIVATLYDLHNKGHEVLIGRLTGDRFDKTKSKERLSLGHLYNDSDFNNGNGDCFGAIYDSEESLLIKNNGLMKLGRVSNDEFISEYQWPKGRHNGKGGPINYDNFIGEEVTRNNQTRHYAGACFKLGHIENASGFMLEIETKEPEKWSINSLTGETNDIILQMCLIEDNQKVTAFMDANFPNDGFKTPDITNFNEPVMYAGLSTPLIKRITFGKRVLTGDVYIRIGIAEESGLTFTKITLKQVI